MKQERQDSRMTENKQKLIALVSALQEENIIDYCYTFIGLKVYGAAKLPDSITAELRQMWEKHFNLPHEEQQEQERHEQTAEEKQAGEYRCNITRMLYGIENLAILNYIRIIVEDVAKEDSGTIGAEKGRIVGLVSSISNIWILDQIAQFIGNMTRKDGVPNG